jgi:thioesterase domain-containing protein
MCEAWTLTLPLTKMSCIQLFLFGMRTGGIFAMLLPQDKPYALYGHCMGAIIAYELANQIVQRRGQPLPVALVAAAVAAPQTYSDRIQLLLNHLHEQGKQNRCTKVGQLEHPPLFQCTSSCCLAGNFAACMGQHAHRKKN